MVQRLDTRATAQWLPRGNINDGGRKGRKKALKALEARKLIKTKKKGPQEPKKRMIN